MTPATSKNPKTFREQIGPAIWLLALLACFAPADWNGDTPVYVAGGNIVTDAELAARLGVSQGTIAKWRRRLRAVGVIGWLVAPWEGRMFWVGAVNRIFSDGNKPQSIPEMEPQTRNGASQPASSQGEHRTPGVEACPMRVFGKRPRFAMRAALKSHDLSGRLSRFGKEKK